jgi:hypothetical protein
MHDMFTQGVGLVYILGVLLLAVFLFWRSVRRSVVLVDDGRSEDEVEADTRRWGYKVFDIMILSIIGALFVSRISYIIASPDVFQGARWFWIPYEKVEGEIFLFASFPWLVFRVWDAALPYQSLLLGWLLSLVALSRILRVPWRFLSSAISEVYVVCLIGLELYIAALWQVWGPMLVVGYLVVLGALRWKTNRDSLAHGSTGVHKMVSALWKLSTIVGLPFAILLIDALYRSFEGREFFLAISILTILVGLWVIAGDLADYINVLRHGAESLLSPKIPSIETGSEISGIQVNVGWRRYLQENPSKKVNTSTPVPRDFSKTYKDYSNAWQRILGKAVGVFAIKKRPATEEIPSRPEVPEDSAGPTQS